MTSEEMLAFLGSRLNYERRGMPETKSLRLDRVVLLLESMGNPHRQYPVIHVAGTKGKGSTSFMLSALLSRSMLRVGLHTSPHLLELEERFRINGKSASPHVLAGLIEEMRPTIAAIDEQLEPDQPGLTFFEITTAMALLYFAREQVDYAVVEVGMGGRLDSTNVVWPEVSVITTISMDHMRQLGNTLDSIAREKAGIIKPGQPVVSGVTAPAAQSVIAQTARENGCLLRQLGRDFAYTYESRGSRGGVARVTTWRRQWPDIELSTLGEHQGANAAVAIAVLETLADTGRSIDPKSLAGALGDLIVAGRVEIIGRHPLRIVDVAHNEASVAALVQTLQATLPQQAGVRGKRVLVFATSRDKDWPQMLELLTPEFDEVILTKYLNNPRAVPPEEIAAGWNSAGKPVHLTTSPQEAWTLAMSRTGGGTTTPQSSGAEQPESLICAAGSFYLISEILALTRASQPDNA